MSEGHKAAPLVSTGLPGLDKVLRGGLPEGEVYLVHGGPGSGKTTLGLQFLFEGVRRGERVLFASLLQTPRELGRIAASHGWTLDGVDLLDMPDAVRRASVEEQSMFSPGEVELQALSDTVAEAIRTHRPQRLVFDSITELAVLVDSPAQLRRQMLRFKNLLDGIGCTSLFTANDTLAVDLPSLQTAVHGVIQLSIERPPYGATDRWLEVTKVRGLKYLSGRQDISLHRGGIEVYPRLEIPAEPRLPQWSQVSSGDKDLDALFGGGLEAGTACLITGTTGAGKSTLASIYVQAAAERGDRSLIFCFDERRQTYIRRSRSLGLNIVQHIDQGLVDLRQVDFGHLTLGRFAHELREAVDEHGVKVVVLDSLTGFQQAIPHEPRQGIIQLHEILSYLRAAGVLTLLIVPSHGLGEGTAMTGEAQASYIADTVVLMRHFEAVGEVRRCISVLKKRHGDHERSIREITSGPGGIALGPPLTAFRNVLSGVPQYIGEHAGLMDRDEESHDADT
ncbi:MAG: ATPase domain-containing protein [Planctomycetota bacterium]